MNIVRTHTSGTGECLHENESERESKILRNITIAGCYYKRLHIREREHESERESKRKIKYFIEKQNNMDF